MTMPVDHFYDTNKPNSESSFARKWQVEGATSVRSEMDRIHIVCWGPAAIRGRSTADMCMRHEFGHAFIISDLKEGLGKFEGFEAMDNYDKWQAEIEAWIRGNEHLSPLAPLALTYENGMLMLDALNSYRRALKIDDRTWRVDTDMTIDALFSPDEARKLKWYIPLEPEPGDDAPNCFDEYEQTGERRDEDEEREREEMRRIQDGARDRKQWSDFEQEILDSPMPRQTAQRYADAHGLDMRDLGPLLQAVIEKDL